MTKLQDAPSAGPLAAADFDRTLAAHFGPYRGRAVRPHIPLGRDQQGRRPDRAAHDAGPDTVPVDAESIRAARALVDAQAADRADSDASVGMLGWMLIGAALLSATLAAMFFIF